MSRTITVEIKADTAAFERAFARLRTRRAWWRRALITLALWRAA